MKCRYLARVKNNFAHTRTRKNEKTRARRLAEYLESECGYTVYQDEKTCHACHHQTFGDVAKFCEKCGTKLRRNLKFKEEAEAQLEEALRHIGV